MSDVALIKMHEGFVYLFLISLFIKVTLLIINVELFRVVRNKTKIVEMILGSLLLISGAMVWNAVYSFDMQGWILIKVVLMLAGIGLTIVSFKKESRPLAFLSVLIFVFIYMLARNHVAWGI